MVSMLSSGPLDSQSRARKEEGYHVKWATSFNGPVGVLNLGPTSNIKGIGKPIVTNLAQSNGNSSSLSSQVLKKLASSVKGKKTIAKGPALKAKPNVAVNPLSNSFVANITSLSFDRVSPPIREKCGSTKQAFEFTASSLAGQELLGDQGSGHIGVPIKADSLTKQGNGDESVDARSNPYFSEESDREGVDVAGMELEDGVRAFSSN